MFRFNAAAVLTAVLVRSLLLGVDACRTFSGAAAFGQAAPVPAGAPTVSAPNQARFDFEAAISPGREELLAEMLGRGELLPGQCRFAAGGVDHTVITSTYQCRDGAVVVELRHPGKAPDTATYTGRFAITVVSGTPPPDLISALASRIRSREAAFEWMWLERAARPKPLSVVFLLIGVALSVTFALGWLLQRWMRRRLVVMPLTAPSFIISGAAVSVLTLLLCAGVHGALRTTGALLTTLLQARPGFAVVGRVALIVALVAASAVAAVLVARGMPRRALRAWVASIVIAYTAVGIWLSLLPQDLHYFGSLSTHPPNASWGDPSRLQVSYRSNHLGFREPDFTEAKLDGVLRVALIGDSYVFGIGVGPEGTLRSQLETVLTQRWPGQRFEVVNLGMPGNNLASHVDLFATTVARLHPDAVILCLTLPNDLSRWDEQVGREDARRFSPFSFVRFLVGDAAQTLWASMFLETSVTPAGLQHLDRQMTRLEKTWRGASGPRVLLLFAFSPWDPAITARLKRIPGVAVVPDGAPLPEEFIAGDGHPTAIGNSRSAVRIADTLASDAAWAELVGNGRRSDTR